MKWSVYLYEVCELNLYPFLPSPSRTLTVYEYCTSPSSSSIDSESLGVSPSTVGVIGSTCARLKHCKDTNQYCHLADQSSLRFMAVVANRSHAFVGTWAHDSCVCVPDIICAMTACLPFVSKHHANKNSKFCGKKKKTVHFIDMF